MDTKNLIFSWKIILMLCTIGKTTLQLENSVMQNSSCPTSCSCSPCETSSLSDVKDVQCRNIDIEDLRDFDLANKICSLDVSWNDIERISPLAFNNMSTVKSLYLSNNLIGLIPENTFKGLKSLKKLFLDHNEIEIIGEEALNGLIQLQYLTLAYNNLKKWHGTLFKILPKIEFLDVTGNGHFNIMKNKLLLTDSSLKTIVGATTSKDCRRCNFTRTDVPRNLLTKTKVCEFIPPYNMPKIDHFQKKYLYFNGACEGKSCPLNLVPMWIVRKTHKDFCYDKARSLRAIEYFLGVVALLFNLVIIATILSSISLIKKTSMFLTAHLALGDLFLSLFSLTIAAGHGIKSDAGIRQWRQHQCPYFRSLMIIGQTIEALTSVLMTVERYLAIVYCMRPNLRITPKVAGFLCVLIWFFCAISCFVIEYFDHVWFRDNYMCVLVQNLQTTKRFMATQVLMLLFVALYLAVVGLYLHIFISARKSARGAGIRRETSLAKRICVIVFSNMIFYAVPNLCIVIFALANTRLASDRAVNFILRIWLPPMCMITNACLNPFLFAFRNEEFLRHLKQRATNIISGLYLTKQLPFSKRLGKRGVYVVKCDQSSSQGTLNESFELHTA